MSGQRARAFALTVDVTVRREAARDEAASGLRTGLGVGGLKAQIVADLSERLVKFTMSRSIAVADALPRQANDKLMNHTLKEPYWADA